MTLDLGSFRRDFVHLGAAPAVIRALYYRLGSWSGCNAYRVLRLVPETCGPEPRGVHQSGASDYEFRLLNDDELAEYSRDPRNRLPPAFLAEARAKGDVCFGVLDRGALAGFGWYASRPTAVERHMTISFDPRYRYMYHGFTRPEYRGHNIHGLGLVRALAACVEQGYAGCVTLAEWGNFASLRSARRAGYRPIGTILRHNRPPRYFVSGGCRICEVAISPQGRPLYRELGEAS